MRKSLAFLVCWLFTAAAMGQNMIGSWETLPSLSNNLASRSVAPMCALNGKLYILGGYAQSSPKDFSSYNPVTKEIKKLRNLGTGGGNTLQGALVPILGKIYHVYGSTISVYDTAANEWTARPFLTVPSGTFSHSTAGNVFAVGDTVFIVSESGNHFYSYNIVSHTLTRRADYPGTGGVRGGFSFALNGRGYWGTGRSNPFNNCNNEANCFSNGFYEYNPATNTWAAKAPYPQSIYYGSGVAVNGKGYAGMGQYLLTQFNVKNSMKWYEYDAIANTWTAKQNFLAVSDASTNDGSLPYEGSLAAIGNSVYYYGGKAGQELNISSSRIAAYNTTSNAWSVVEAQPQGNRTQAAGFHVNGKLYLGGGQDDVSQRDFWEYDIASKTWTAKSPFVTSHEQRACVELGGKGYFIGGYGKNNQSTVNFPQAQFIDSVWEYTPATNTWAMKTKYPGGKRGRMIAYAYNGELYTGLGFDGNGAPTVDFYKYNPTTNVWTVRAAPPVTNVYTGIHGFFTLGDTAYLTALNSSTLTLYKYSFLSNSWTSSPISGAVNLFDYTNQCFVFNGQAFGVFGASELFAYSQASGLWTKVLNLPFATTSNTIIPTPNAVYFAFGEGGVDSIGTPRSNDLRRLLFNQMISRQRGVFTTLVSGGTNPACGTGQMTATTVHAIYDSVGKLCASFHNSPSNSLVASVCADFNAKDSNLAYAFRAGNYGQGFSENGWHMNKSIRFRGMNAVTNNNQLRFYLTTSEVNKFLQSFNAAFGRNKTVDSIRFHSSWTAPGTDSDFDPTNNGNNAPHQLLTPVVAPYLDGYSFTLSISSSGGSILGEVYPVLTTTASALPLSNYTLTGEAGATANLLRWKRSSADDAKWFELERSNDGQRFSTIEKMEATALNLYSFTDQQPQQPVHFYRLKVSEANGMSRYTQVVRLEHASTAAVKIYPNPAKEMTTLYLAATNAKTAPAQLTDVQGRVLRQWNLVQGANTLELAGLAPGIYWVVTQDKGRYQLVKQ